MNPERRKPEFDLLAVGNPSFDEPWKRTRMPHVNITDAELIKLTKHREALSPLPYSEVEVAVLGSNVKKNKILLNDQATEKAFKEFADKARIIHLATHSIVERANPLYSRIAFASEPRIHQHGEDGNLFTYEIFDLKLNADLVVLSGCETGLGRLRRGEGLEGMSRAFLYAGAPALVASLWKIADKEPTPQLMEKFYRYLTNGLDKRTALQRAKFDMIAEGKYDNPFFWAPFILIGDTSPVPLSNPIPAWLITATTISLLFASVRTYLVRTRLRRRMARVKEMIAECSKKIKQS